MVSSKELSHKQLNKVPQESASLEQSFENMIILLK
jgi:hypothetical protein